MSSNKKTLQVSKFVGLNKRLKKSKKKSKKKWKKARLTFLSILSDDQKTIWAAFVITCQECKFQTCL